VSNKAGSDKTDKEEVFHLIQRHPEGQDDDICRMRGIMPRQQVQQLCNRLAASTEFGANRLKSPESGGRFTISQSNQARQLIWRDWNGPGIKPGIVFTDDFFFRHLF